MTKSEQRARSVSFRKISGAFSMSFISDAKCYGICFTLFLVSLDTNFIVFLVQFHVYKSSFGHKLLASYFFFASFALL